MPAVELIEVTRSFSGKGVVEPVSLAVEGGEMVWVSGPSGAGKTTLLRLVAGLELPDSGRVMIDGRLASGEGAYVPPGRRDVGMVFQDFALWPHMRVARHIDFVLRGRGMGRASRRERINELLELVRLSDRARAFPSELSGGEQQRLSIARALAPRPSILLLDEPFSNLDEKLTWRVLSEVLRFKEARKAAVLIAAHDHKRIEEAADRLLLMGDKN